MKRPLEPFERELDARTVTLSFRDDDAGWEDERLLALLDLFAGHSVPVDVAVIPESLGGDLAAELRRRRDEGAVALHQHGRAHVNHEPHGRPCEFGMSRNAAAQRRDLEAGRERLRDLLGGTDPLFTPPWNRCTPTTGRCLAELGFRGLVRDSDAEPLEVDGLEELHVHVDWARPAESERGARLAAAARTGRVGVMLHHALLDRRELDAVAELLELVASHPNARCVPLGSVLEP